MRTAYKILIGLWFIPLALFVIFIILISTKTIGGLIFSAVFLIWAYNGAIIMLVITALTLLYYLIKGKWLQDNNLSFTRIFFRRHC